MGAKSNPVYKKVMGIGVKVVKQRLKGYILLSIISVILFFMVFVFGFSGNLIYLSRRINDFKEKIDLDKAFNKALEQAIKYIFTDLDPEFDDSLEMTDQELVYNDYIIYIRALSGKIPVNVLKFELLKKMQIFNESDLYILTTFRADNDFIISQDQIEELIGKKYDNLDQVITFYSDFNIRIIDSYTFARLYVLMTNHQDQYKNAADFFQFQQHKILQVSEIENFYNLSTLQDIRSMDEYLTLDGIINFYQCSEKNIRYICQFIGLKEPAISGILSAKQKGKSAVPKINQLLTKEESKKFWNYFSLYSKYFQVEIMNKIDKKKYFYIVKKILDDKNNIVAVRVLKKYENTEDQ